MANAKCLSLANLNRMTAGCSAFGNHDNALSNYFLLKLALIEYTKLPYVTFSPSNALLISKESKSNFAIAYMNKVKK